MINQTIIQLLSLATLASAVLAIIYRQRSNFKLFSIFKPLTTTLIIVIALLIYKQNSNDYTSYMIIALILSLIGDIFLIRDKYFLPGLASFLIAHVFFTIGITNLYGFNYNLIPLFILILVGGFYFNFIKKDLKKFTIPVLVYITVILIMNWQAINLVVVHHKITFLAIAIASIVFSVSDAILAYDKFKKPFKSAEILILSTYWVSIFTFTIIGLYIY